MHPFTKHLSLAFVLCLTAIIICAPAAMAKEEGYTDLFNGKDLSGWDGNPDFWSVDKGEILGSTHEKRVKYNEFLISEKSYKDFSLKVKVWLENGNSGIQFRSKTLEKPWSVGGYQADVAVETYYGMLYEEQGRGIMPYWNEKTDEERKAIFDVAKQGEWNEYEIICEGDHVKMILNGTVTCDIVDPDGAKEGIIALQIHTGPKMNVRFKDIRIKELNKK